MRAFLRPIQDTSRVLFPRPGSSLSTDNAGSGISSETRRRAASTDGRIADIVTRGPVKPMPQLMHWTLSARPPAATPVPDVRAGARGIGDCPVSFIALKLDDLAAEFCNRPALTVDFFSLFGLFKKSQRNRKIKPRHNAIMGPGEIFTT